MATRTQDEILARIEAVKPNDFFGFKRDLLVAQLDYGHAKPFLGDEVTADDWANATAGILPPAEAGADYVEFAVEKMRDERGISANRSVQKFAEWAWLDGLDDLAEQIDDERNYGWYGDQAVRLYTDHYGLTWPEENCSMAQKTSDKTAAKLATLIDAHHHEGPAALHGHILDQFRVVDQPAARGEQPEPAVGQTWRNRTSARLVKITAISGTWRDQVEWECIDGSRGPKTGNVWLHYWTDRFDHEETA